MAEWKSGLCGCFGNCGSCILTAIFPCVTMGNNAKAVDKSCALYGLGTLIPLINCVLGSNVRGAIRERRLIGGSRVGDCLTYVFCGFCALVQESQEIQFLSTGPQPTECPAPAPAPPPEQEMTRTETEEPAPPEEPKEGDAGPETAA